MTTGPDADPGSARRRQALNTLVIGDEVVIILPGGQRRRLDASAAEVSGWRLLDAAAIARGVLPGART